MSRRTLRVASLIRSLLGNALQTELHDPRIAPLTSITRVEVSQDLSVAHVYVSVLAEREAQRELTLKALRNATGRLRGVLAPQLSLRQVPELVFRLDQSVRGSFETIQLIDQLMAEDERPGEPGAADESVGHAEDK